MQKKEKTVIGWSEHVSFPEWGIQQVHAKIDTGARTSALHVEEIKFLPNGYIEFVVVVGADHPRQNVKVIAKLLKTARVRSSTGVFTKRCFVKTKVVIGPIEKTIEISLVSREKMMFRMLLGRKALEKDFLVDVSLKENLKKARKEKQRKPE